MNKENPVLVGKSIYRQLFNSGKGTDYFYSPDYEEMCKERAINIAKAKYDGEFLIELVRFIENM